MKPTPGEHGAARLPGASEMARRIRDFDWSATGLGPVDEWPQSLLTSVATCLECAFPFVLWWGPDLITIYNDEFQFVLGAKHPSALGDRAQNVWREIWDVIGPMLARVMQHGESTRSRDLPLIVDRHGYTEECYFSFSSGPIHDEHGGVDGILCPVIETTDHVIGERRLRTLRDLRSRTPGAATEVSACCSVAEALAGNRHDVPFALIYLIDPAGSIARLAASAGIAPDTAAAPAMVALSPDAADAWTLGPVARSGKPAVITSLRDRFDVLPTGAWPDPPQSAMLIPVSPPGQERPRAILVAAVSPRHALDADYRTFFELVAIQLASGLADARRQLVRIGAHLELSRVRRESERRVTHILESISDAFMVFDAGWRLTYLNPVARQVFASHGMDPDAMIGKHCWDELFPDAREGDAAKLMFHAMARREPVAFENYHAPWDAWHSVRVDPLPGGGLANYFQDITPRKRAESALRESEERFRGTFENPAVGIAHRDATGRFLRVNARYCKIVGYDRDELFRRTFYDLTHPEDLAAEVRQFAAMMRGELPSYSMEKRYIRKDGTVVWVQLTMSLQRDAAGAPAYGIAVLQDISERKRAEEALRHSEERFRRYFELGRIGLAITSPTKGFLEVNDRLCEIFGYERGELLRRTWAELTHPEDLAANMTQFARVLAGESDGYSLDKRWIRKDGTVIHGTVSVSCIRRPDRSVDYFVALLEDLTERTRFQTALRESEERYRSLISQVKDYAIFATDEHGIVTTWNEGCQHVLGYAEEEFLGLDTAELFTPEDRAAGAPAERYREAAEAGTATGDRWMIARGGRRFFAVGSTAGLRDAAGHLIGFSTVMRDATRMKLSQDALAHHGESLERLVTERTEELEKAAERLRLSERMASLGTLTAGLGHDMGNLLLPLDVRLELLLRAELPLELHEHVVGIQKCARYLQRLSKGLRLLATDPAGARMEAATELWAWWNDASMILKDVLPRNVEFEHRLPGSKCWVAMGRTALTQAVFNLVQNAGDALRERGTGCVRISADSEPPGAWVTVSVTDDGPGMTAEVLRRCIEPYYSTKSRAVATGMGLPFVHGLVTAAGGRIEVDSTRGRGTTITLTLPSAEPREAPGGTGPEAAAKVADAR